MRLIALALAIVACGGCSSKEPSSSTSTVPIGSSPEEVAAGLSALRSEPKVQAAVHFPHGHEGGEWRVAVQDDGTRRDGFAEYLCTTLIGAGVVNGEALVRVVSDAQVVNVERPSDDAVLGRKLCIHQQ